MRKKYNLYAVKKDGKHLGVFKASTIAEKIGCSLSSISIAARKGFIIKGRYEVKKQKEQRAQEEHLSYLFGTNIMKIRRNMKMNKIYCDRCGQECIDTFLTIDIVAEDVKKEQPGTVTFSTAMYNTSRGMRKFSGKNKQYCIECIKKIEEYIENIPTETIKEKDTKGAINIVKAGGTND